MLSLLWMFCKLGMYCKTLLGNKHYCKTLLGALLCNAEHLFGTINKIVVFYYCCALLQLCVDIL